MIEILWFSTLTLYKIFSKNPEAVISLASKMLGLLNELDVKGSQMALLKIKFHLFIIGIIVKQRRGDISHAENEFKSEVKLIHELKSEIAEPDTIQRITFELEFARAYYLNRQKKDKHGEGQKRFQEIVKILKESCDKILGTLHYQTDVDRAKVALLLSKVQILSTRGTADTILKERLFSGLKQFQRSTKKLALQTSYSIGYLHYQYIIQFLIFSKANFERHFAQKTLSMEESAQLDRIKKIYLKQEALSLVKSVNPIRVLVDNIITIDQ